MALEEAFETAASGYTEAVTEFHIVGGLHPDLPFQYFLDLCSGLKQRFPQVHLKAFTMVEVAYLAKRAKLSIRATLEKLKAAGVDSLPGGGAEIFADRIRHIICDHKIDGDQWLDTAKLAHQIGLKSNATMLYGHVENDEDRVDHLLKLRALQDETGGFQTSSHWLSIPRTRPCSTCRKPPACSTSSRSRSAGCCSTISRTSKPTGR